MSVQMNPVKAYHDDIGNPDYENGWERIFGDKNKKDCGINNKEKNMPKGKGYKGKKKKK